MSEFVFNIFKDEDGEHIVEMRPGEATFEEWMILAGYLCFMVAQNSGCGFEKALELVCKHATDWKNK